MTDWEIAEKKQHIDSFMTFSYESKKCTVLLQSLYIDFWYRIAICQQFLDQVNKDETWMYGFNMETIMQYLPQIGTKIFCGKNKKTCQVKCGSHDFFLLIIIYFNWSCTIRLSNFVLLKSLLKCWVLTYWSFSAFYYY